MNHFAQHHAAVDATLIQALAGAKLTPCCAKGCYACCFESVYSTRAEVRYILNGMTGAALCELKPRLRQWLEQAKPILGLKMPNALTYRAQNIPCPFLKGGLCSIYERRPHGCRVFLALGQPKDCDLPARQHQKFAEFDETFYHRVGMPPMISEPDGYVITDHLAVLCAEEILHANISSASRTQFKTKHP